MLYLITGINGVGKSKFIDDIVDDMKNFHVIKGSSELMRELKIKPGDYETLRNFDNTTKNNILKKIILNANKRYGRSLSEHAVMDAHILNMNNGKITQVMDHDMIKPFTAVIYLSAKAGDILKRLDKDALVRDRAMFQSSKELTSTQALTLYMKEFKETLLKECSLADVLMQEIPNLDYKTSLAIAAFKDLHVCILNQA